MQNNKSIAPYQVSYDLSSKLYDTVYPHIRWVPWCWPLDGSMPLAHKDAGPIRSVQPGGVTLAYVEEGDTERGCRCRRCDTRSEGGEESGRR